MSSCRMGRPGIPRLSPSLRIGLAAGLSALLVAGATAFQIARDYHNALAAAEQLAVRTNVLYAEALNRTFEVISAAEAAAVRAFVDHATGQPAAEADPHLFLKRLADTSPVFQGIAWI